MENPQFVVSEDNVVTPILIVDKHGIIAYSLSAQLTTAFLTIVVSGIQTNNPNSIHIPYRHHIPSIPDNAFSHILFIYHGSKDEIAILPHLLQKAKDLDARFFFISSIRTSPSHVVHNIIKAYDQAYVLLCGDVFAGQLVFANRVMKLLIEAQTRGKMTLLNDGLSVVYPIHLDDVIAEIVRLSFSQASIHRLLYLFPNAEYTELSLAHMIQKRNPLIKVDFRKGVKDEKLILPHGGQYASVSYPLEDRLSKTAVIPPKEEQITKKLFATEKRNKKKYLLPILAAFFVFFSPILFLFIFGSVGYTALQYAKNELEKGNLTKAVVFAQTAQTTLQSTAQGLKTMQNVLPFFATKLEPYTQNAKVGSVLASEIVDNTEAVKKLLRVYQGKSLDPTTEFVQAIETLKNSSLFLQQLIAENTLPYQYAAKIKSYEKPIHIFQTMADVLPVLLGFPEKKDYLILFQNNMELRPGGGFIGSYGILTLEKGRMTNLSIHDVYDADGQLKGHIEPPFLLRRYLGASHLFLRDSNTALDFPTNASLAAYMLNIETGQKVNGVIAIDTYFIRNLLEAIGPVQIPDYNETITANDFFQKIESHVQDNFFPGSTQKKDFLRAVFGALEGKMKKGEFSPLAMSSTIAESLSQKHMQLSVSNPAVEQVFLVNNYASSPQKTKRDGEYPDFLGINEANLGANKANFYLTRRITQSVEIAKTGEVQEKVRIEYANKSQENDKFGGDYKAYIRFILPQGSEVETVTIDNVKQTVFAAVTDPGIYLGKRFVPPLGLEVEQSNIVDKTVYGFLVMVPKGQTKSVDIQYKRTEKYPVGDAASSYVITLFKQPGTDADRYHLTILYPDDFIFLKGSENVDKKTGEVRWATDLSEDQALTLQFTKK